MGTSGSYGGSGKSSWRKARDATRAPLAVVLAAVREKVLHLPHPLATNQTSSTFCGGLATVSGPMIRNCAAQASCRRSR